MRSIRSHALVTLAALLVAAGCITPSIPIPPPSPERMVFDLDATGGTATFAYPPDDNYAEAIVHVFNRTLGEGVITTAASDGRITTSPFPADLGNEVSVTIEADEQTVSTCVVLRASGPVASCAF
jgi:hypothetical protein